ncbi:MAG: helix-hairpin-helix domain-containing protein [Agathobacter sp.]|nr:helix-hairpin-helix domain-containing protein [Agathobacter sp.]
MKFVWLLITGALLLCTGCASQSQVYLSTERTESTEDILEVQLETESEEKLLYVYVCGAVRTPSVFSFKEGARVWEAIEAAGGFLEDARTDYWNQAMVLNDGEMIYVPRIDEDVEDPEVKASSQDSEDGRININTASKEQLMGLPGIGESKALQILSYREEHGEFSSTEDIMNVPGIKEAMYSKIKDYIRVD